MATCHREVIPAASDGVVEREEVLYPISDCVEATGGVPSWRNKRPAFACNGGGDGLGSLVY